MAKRIEPGTETARPDRYAPSREAPGFQDRPDEALAQEPRRSYVVPLAIALAVFVILIVARVVWGGMESRRAATPTAPQVETEAPGPQPSP
jgi:hypothetical protein